MLTMTPPSGIFIYESLSTRLKRVLKVKRKVMAE